MKSKKTNKKWICFRHKVVTKIAGAVLAPYSRIKYGVSIERFEKQGERPYLILLNHQTPFDQFFVGMAFKGAIYYLATEDIFSNGFVSSLIRYLVAPIPIKKQTNDIRAILNCIRVAKEGGTIAIAPEGNRTYSGRTEYMSPTISSLAKKLNLPIAIFRIEGGYGVQPRWSDVVRKGKMRGYVSRVIEPEEFLPMSDDELFSLIERELFVDEAVADREFRHKKSAEYLERAFYVCPFCGLSEFYSENDIVSCKKCGRRIRYLPTKELSGIGFEFPYRFAAEWYDAQEDFINALDVTKQTDEPFYRENANISEVIPYKNKKSLFKNASVSLFGDRIEIDSDGVKTVWDFEKVLSVAVLGRNKLNVYYEKQIFQFKGGKRFNALKYVHIFHRYKNIKEGDEDVKFLGL